MKKYLLIILIIILSGVLLFSGYKIYTIMSEYKQGEETYSELQQFVVLPAEGQSDERPSLADLPDLPIAGTDSESQTEGTASPTGSVTGRSDIGTSPFTFPTVDFDSLLAINEDVVGWIYVPNTEISYPVVQGKDNKYYLYRLIDRRGNGSGSIFMDFRNDRDMSDRNTILYGHHMNNGTMFAKLVGYKKQAFYEEHKIFQFMTPGQNYQMDVVAAYVANTKMDAWKLGFPEDSDAETWIGTALKRSVIKTGYTYTPGDRFITLSTCTYEFDNARFVVIGVIREK